MIEMLSDFPDGVIAVRCHGHVTQQDYDTVLVPAVSAALKRHDRVRLFYETAPDFTGFEAGAAWEDFKVGMEHFARWERVAVVSDVGWIRQIMTFFGFMMPGQARVFSGGQEAEARAWIVADMPA